jgi:diadenylate cyclase
MQDAWSALTSRGAGWIDILDILAVAVLLFFILRQVRGTPAVQMLLGVIVLALANALSQFMEMTATHRFLQNLLFYIPFAIIVLFREPIRKALAVLGSTFFTPRGSLDLRSQLARETAIAAFSLAHLKHGALITFERTQGLKDYADTGVKVGAELSSNLLSTIFFPGTALHDGAAVVMDGRLAAAGCYLPLSAREFPQEYGTRHRAAAGISELTDAVCVIVSEERGTVSLATEGEFETVKSGEELEKRLFRLLGGKPREQAAHADDP